jgi:hypothetical protein
MAKEPVQWPTPGDSVIPRCPQCRARVIQKSDGGKFKIRTNILVFDSGGAVVKCRKCHADIKLDLRMGEELRKSLSRPEPRLVVGSRNKNIDLSGSDS